ncbi:MAG: 5-(carboxyamino)imidazole ribonucleotide synthase [Acidimicrobiales bacterium]
MTDRLSPGSTVGIVGGGQLGRMLSAAAHRLGYRTAVLTGGAKDTPAGSVADIEIALPFDDETAVERLVAESDVITWEFENVDVRLADRALESGVAVHPSAQIVASAQDRRLEKLALVDAGAPVAAWRPVDTILDWINAVDDLGTPAIAKTARFGYDGKGQVRINDKVAIEDAWGELAGEPAIIESVVDFTEEISVVVARGADGSVVHHGVMQNDHVDHILDTTTVPAAIAPHRATEAIAIAERIAETWQLVGVLCVEMFNTSDGLIVNEVAPRPHNSGHCTLEAAPASQFEQQLRAICGLPLGDGECRPAAMVQLLGDLWATGEPDWSRALEFTDVHLHLYGKTEARPGRKMGHMTCLGTNPRDALATALRAREALAR